MEPSQESEATKRYKKSNKPIVIFLHFLDSVLLPSHRKFGKGFWSMELGKSPFIHTDRSTVFTVHERIEVPSRNTQQSRLGVKIQNSKMALTLNALSFGLRLNIFAYAESNKKPDIFSLSVYIALDPKRQVPLVLVN